MIPKAQIWLVLNLPVFMFVYIHFNVPPTKITDLVRNVSDEKIWNSHVCPCFCFYQLGLCYTANLTRHNLSASCGGICLNWVYRHPSQLSVPEVPNTVSPKLQPYWLKI